MLIGFCHRRQRISFLLPLVDHHILGGSADFSLMGVLAKSLPGPMVPRSSSTPYRFGDTSGSIHYFMRVKTDEKDEC